jgi:hypothetical protein
MTLLVSTSAPSRPSVRLFAAYLEILPVKFPGQLVRKSGDKSSFEALQSNDSGSFLVLDRTPLVSIRGGILLTPEIPLNKTYL